MRAELTRLAVPRPIAEYHEDMGDVLWWCWLESQGKWLGEPPYVGSPNDLGHSVKFEVVVASSERLKEQPRSEIEHTIGVGGFPGYHTHFTPIPLPKEPSQ